MYKKLKLLGRIQKVDDFGVWVQCIPGIVGKIERLDS